MIQNYTQMKDQIELINSEISQNAQIQKIYSSISFIVMHIRSPGKNHFLYIGRGGSVQGIWIETETLASELRTKDKFLEYLRKFLRGQRLTQLTMDTEDRCFSIDFKYGQKLSRLFMFYRGSKTYICHSYFDEKKNCYVEFGPERIYDCCKMVASFEVMNKVGRYNIKKDNVKNDKMEDIQSILSKESFSLDVVNKKTINKLKKKILNIQKDLTKAEVAKELFSFLQLPDTNLDQLPQKTEILGVKFNFKTAGHFQRLNEVYKKIKGFKKAKEILTTRLGDTKNDLTKLLSRPKHQKLSPREIFWPGRLPAKSTKVENVNLNYKIHDQISYQVGVGLSALGNDQLRSSWAKKDDWWFHLESRSSAHIVVKLITKKVLDDECLKYVADIFANYSGGQSSEIDLIYTLIKNVKGIKGSQGKVLFKKEKRLRIII